MNDAEIVRRETAISVVINVFLSAVFFLAVFGVAVPAPVRGVGGYAFDFLPQAFMVALMGSMVPALLTARRLRTGRSGAIMRRCALVAVLAAALLGGAALALLYATDLNRIAPLLALAIKIIFGGAEALILTPGAVRHALASRVGGEAAP